MCIFGFSIWLKNTIDIFWVLDFWISDLDEIEFQIQLQENWNY